MKKHLSVRYGTIQGCYWMGYAALMGYASVYLLEKGFTNTQIGLLRQLAVSCQRFCSLRWHPTQIGRKARPYEQCSLERT